MCMLKCVCSDAVHGYWNVAEADMILRLLQHFEAKYKVQVGNPQRVCVITMYNKQVIRSYKFYMYFILCYVAAVCGYPNGVELL